MYKRSLYENIMKEVSKVIKKRLNEVLLQWGDGENNELPDDSNNIVKSGDVAKQLGGIDIRDIADEDIIDESLYEYPEFMDTDYISIANFHLNQIFPSKKKFLEYIKKCIKKNWDYVCEEDYRTLDKNGWNIYITDAMNDVEKHYGEIYAYFNSPMPQIPPNMPSELDDEELFWKADEWLFGQYGLVWHMVQENCLDIKLKDHPQAHLYE